MPADPFTRVVFLNHSQATESLKKTICPRWDQTLIFETVEIHGDPQSVANNPPKVIVEIFDYDSFVSQFYFIQNLPMPDLMIDTEESLPFWPRV